MATAAKTNVMRILTQKKISFVSHEYPHSASDLIDGVSVANKLHRNVEEVYKTLVTVGADKTHFVFVIPVNEQLDLKKAAKSVGEKSIMMIKQNELLPLTGYVHGGCSPIGMKKLFKTVFHSAVNELKTVTVSAGKIGYQIELSPEDIIKLVRAETADIIVE